MKVNNYICPILAVLLAMLTSVCSAQSGSKTAIPAAVPQAQDVAQDVTSYAVDTPESNMVVSEVIMPAQPAYEAGPEVYDTEITGSGCCMPAPMIQDCDCSSGSCQRCRPKRQRPACRCKRLGCQGECEVVVEPASMFQSCEGDFCKLSIKKGKETKTCFTTEQVPVCIPAVRFPWQECCPPSKSKTRLVTKLKTVKSKVDSCSYKWSVEETNNCGSEPIAEAVSTTAAPAETAPVKDASSEPTKAEKSDVKSDVEATIEENVVPPAPKVKGAFLRTFKRR